MIGRVLRSSRRVFRVLVSDENPNQIQSQEQPSTTVEATALGNLLKKDNEIVPGDLVEIERDPHQKDAYIIVKCLDRTNSIFRYIQRIQRSKVLAANIDLLAITCTLSLPEYKQGLVDRYLVRASQWGIPAVLIFNKLDQYEPESWEFDLEFEIERIKSLTERVYVVSATETNLAYDPQPSFRELQEDLRGKSILFLGASGVGKSKLISALAGEKFNPPSGELAAVGKGAHTTTWTELIPHGDFYLLDSPGVRSFSLADIPADELSDYFPDLLETFSECKFHDCKHTPDSSGCTFNRKNICETLISRFRSYSRIKSELK